MSGKFSGIGGLGSAKNFLLEFQGVDLWSVDAYIYSLWRQLYALLGYGRRRILGLWKIRVVPVPTLNTVRKLCPEWTSDGKSPWWTHGSLISLGRSLLACFLLQPNVPKSFCNTGSSGSPWKIEDLNDYWSFMFHRYCREDFAESFIRNEKENPSGFLPEEVCMYMEQCPQNPRWPWEQL
jgi:hypothetical protein